MGAGKSGQGLVQGQAVAELGGTRSPSLSLLQLFKCFNYPKGPCEGSL